MSGPDRRSEPEWPIRPDQPSTEEHPRTIQRDATEVRTGRRGMNPLLIAIPALLLVLFLAWFFTGNRNPDQDKLTGASSRQASATDPEKLCASKTTYDLIKRDLFRRAAQVRGSDQAAFDRLSAYATLRMENPVMETEGNDESGIGCSGNLYLDLPPGVGVVGGRRTLSADVEYNVRQAADGSGTVVLLRNADAVITPLATLARTNQQQQSPATVANDAGVNDPIDSGDAAAPVAPPQPAEPPRPAPPEPRQAGAARPSFNCANARTRGEIAVCSDGGLASLDRQMAAQFGRAVSGADPGQRALLQRTRSRFLSYRDSCRTDACIADAYRGRMREISDIMAGRWQPN